MPFPQDFLWGAATASYQIEGAALEDGRGECIWTRFSHTPGKVFNGDTGDVACDHYHRYRDDVKLMQTLGLQAYRFSVAWSRVMPTGTGATNPLGLDFYDKLVDTLLAANIQPFLTLYHWDLPQALQDRGGWANHDIVNWFADYSEVIAQRFGDRVKNFMTLNEPFVTAFIGHFEGRHAPGIQDLPTAIKAAHHLHLAHAAGAKVLRENVENVKVGIVLNYTQSDAATDQPDDVEVARLQDGYINRWFLDPVLKGRYPADMVEHYGRAMDGIDLSEISQAAVPLDFLGQNYYFRSRVIKDKNKTLLPYKEVPLEGAEFTQMGWEVFPVGIRNMLVRIHQEYQPPAIYITENGSAFNDPAPTNGVVEDPRRTAYLKAHLEGCQAAIEAGVPLKGYFVWSLLDNFEWAYGFSKRFGIIHINYETQERIWKRSAHYFKGVIQANAVIAAP